MTLFFADVGADEACGYWTGFGNDHETDIEAGWNLDNVMDLALHPGALQRAEK